MDLRVENQEDEQDQDSNDSNGQESLLLHSVDRSDVKGEAEEKMDCMVSLRSSEETVQRTEMRVLTSKSSSSTSRLRDRCPNPLAPARSSKRKAIA